MVAIGGWWVMKELDKAHLFEIADFKDKIVLDVGSGFGRLAFAAAERAAWVYASEPVDMLREYMRDRMERDNIKNIRVVDGVVLNLPYPDNTFDIVMSGDVVGDEYDAEIAELTRVCKSGGWLLDSPSTYEAEDEENDDLTERGWEAVGYGKSRKQIFK
jgi:ubiquinone/menaquinone biosynthesis C-methylase UbiE